MSQNLAKERQAIPVATEDIDSAPIGRPLTLDERMRAALDAALADGACLSYHSRKGGREEAQERAEILSAWAKSRDLVAYDQEIDEPSTAERPYANRCIDFPNGGRVYVFAYRILVSAKHDGWRPSDSAVTP